MHWSVHIDGGPRRVNHAAVCVGNLIYSFGGYCTGENYSIQRPIDIHVLNPSTYRWKQLNIRADPATTPFQRYGHTVVAHGQYVYLWGGRNDENACKILYRFNTKTLTWEKPEVHGVCPGARDGHSSVVIRNQMLIFGGYEEDVGLFSQDVYSLDLNTLTWAYVPASGPTPSFRDFHTASVYLDRYMLVFGGRGDRHGPFHTRTEIYCNILCCFDVERQEWVRPQTRGEAPDGRRSHSAFMHNGLLYIFGGYNGDTDMHYNDLHKYNPETKEWTEITPFGHGPSPRRRQGCVVVDGRVFFFGGTSPMPDSDEDSLLDDEETSLIDHDDLFVLDLEPSLKTLCLVQVIETSKRQDLSPLIIPKDIKQELNWMVARNQVSTSSPATASG